MRGRLTGLGACFLSSRMVFQKTTFERLFAVTLSNSGLLTETSFGFESAGKRHFSVTVPGRPRIEQGMSVIALLEKPNQWSSRNLVGWVDCLDGTLVCDSPSKLFGISLLCVFWVSVFYISTYSVFGNTERADIVAILIIAIFGASALRFAYLSAKAFLVRRALFSILTLMEEQS